jgi:flagellar FliJ protein
MQNILNIKYKLEEQAKQEYADAQFRYQQEVERLESLNHRKTLYTEEMRSYALQGVNVVELERCNDAIFVLDDMISSQKEKVFHARAEVDRTRVKLNESMQDRKTHEKLKEHQFESFLQELNAEEMKEIDELVSYKYNPKEEGE